MVESADAVVVVAVFDDAAKPWRRRVTSEWRKKVLASPPLLNRMLEQMHWLLPFPRQPPRQKWHEKPPIGWSSRW